jgi:hypothetical protein
MEYINRLYNETLQLLKKNMVLVQPFILYFIIFGLVITPASSNPGIKSTTVSLVSIFLVSVVFNAGWYNMLYKCVKTPVNENLSKSEQAMKSLSLFKEFLPGVALYFKDFLCGGLIYVALLAIILLGTLNIGLDQIGIPIGVSWSDFAEAARDQETVQKYLQSLPAGTYYQLAKWNFLIMVTTFIIFLLNFLTMFWAQSILFIKINCVRAYIMSVKLIFRHPIRSLNIGVIYALSLNLSFLVFAFPNILIKFIGLTLLILTITYFNLLIFKYLDKQNLNHHSRTDSVGEN